MRKLISIILNFIFRLFSIQENKIVFESGFNKADGNPLALYNYIKKHYPNKFECIWIVSKTTDISGLDKKDVRYYYHLNTYFHQATAKYWIKSQSTSSIVEKRKEQIYLQVEHSGAVFKKCGYDIKGEYPGVPMDFVKEWTYFISSDKRNAAEIRSATGYEGKLEILGLARTDLIVNHTSKDIKRIKEKLNLLHEKRKIIMYAPTFRDIDKVSYTTRLPIKEFGEKKDCLFLVKLHPQALGINPQIELPENVRDLSYYPDVQDLLLITDLLISDYSTIVFEFCLLRRPMLFYMFDLEEYLVERGGFDLDINSELPGPIAYNEEELMEYLNSDTWQKKYNKKIEKSNKEFNYLHDGKVCKRIVEKIINKEFKA